MSPDHAARRRRLTDRVNAPILLVSNGPRARNLPMNALPFRADSTFLYFTGCDEPGAAALLVGDTCTLFLTPSEPDDALWHGAVHSLEDRAHRLGADAVRPLSELDTSCAMYRRRLLSVSVPDPSQTALASRLCGIPLGYPSPAGPDSLVDAIIAMRRILDTWELAEMRRGAEIAGNAHVTAMKATRPGLVERHIAALFDAVVAAHGATNPYPSIVTVRGDILHNHSYGNRLGADHMLLLDGGAELPSGLATDVTRTWPVRGRFDARQRDIYDIVLAAQLASIALVRAGQRYGDIHWAASRVLAEGLRSIGLLRGGADTAVESGAVGLFFPHGVGHLLGLDVHDLENFGDRPAYAPGRVRPKQFGARSLRLDLDLVPDMCVTIEPGIYFVAAILHDPALRAAHAEHVDFDAAEAWLGFGGIRIEDDVRVTASDPEVLTSAIPKLPAEIEALVGSGPSAAERLSA